MLLHGRVVWLGCTIFLMAALVPAFAQTESAMAGTPAFTMTVKAGLEPLPYGCKIVSHPKKSRKLSSGTRTRVQHLCELGMESHYVFKNYTRDAHVRALWLWQKAKCKQAPGHDKAWAAKCFKAREKMRDHLDRLKWVKTTVNALVPKPQPHLAKDWLYQAFICIHGYEGAWTANTGNGYYGGLQMDWSFMRTYGAEFVRKWGSADNWPAWAQITAGKRAYASGRGFGPWPNTALACRLSTASITPGRISPRDL